MLNAGARVALFVDDFGQADLAQPGCTIIGRVYSNFTAESQRGEDPASAADRFVSSQREKYELNPKIRVWCGHNEPVWSNATDMAWYSAFESARVRQMASLGLRCVIGNFSTGNPDLPLWDAFLPAIRVTLSNSGMLGVHEYSSPWMWWMTGRYQLDPNADAGNVGWTTLRYRQVIRDYLKPVGLETIPIVITECGLDRVGKVRPGMSSGNWRTNAAWWNAQNSSDGPIPFDPDGEKYYAEQLKWYDRELQKDASVLGAVIFTIGSYGLPWSEYDIDGTNVIKYLSEHIAAEAGNTNPPPPTPTPTPDPIPTETPMALNFSDIYEWDAQAGAPEPGNTIQIPKGMDFAYVFDRNVRLKWNDIKQGSPTYGQQRTSDSPFLKPEVMPKTQEQMPDIPFPVGVPTLSKCFKGYAPIWVLYIATFDTVVGSQYKLTWPVRPELVANYVGSVKVYAGDPAAGWLRLRVKAGNASIAIDSSVMPNSSWYNGLDFVFGHWFSPQVAIDATFATMKVGLEFICPFGLQDDDIIVSPPVLELVSGGGSTEPPPVPAGTLRGLAQQTLAAAQQAEAGVQQVVAATTALNGLIG